MRSKEELKKAVCEAIDGHREQIVEIGEHILHNPETGFNETETAKLVAEKMEGLGLRPHTGLALTGVKGALETSGEGPSLAIIGELDSLRVTEHPHANQQSGAAHACGHNAQIAGMLGAAMGLISAGAPADLAGKLMFFAVPAEEFIDVEERLARKESGEIGFLTGKGELIRLGHFDDVDMAMMIHTSNGEGHISGMADSSNGAVIKRIRFTGKPAHAGSKPQAGINALNAATLAMTAIALNRETFYDEDTIRIHPIITKGGDAVSVVPAEVEMETFVRGRTLEAILDANAKVDRCLKAAAMAIGAEVEIQTIPGYLPQRNNMAIGTRFGENLRTVFPDAEFQLGGHRTGSTDMGDVGHLKPVIHPYLLGASGNAHSHTWMIADQDNAYVAPAKLLAMTAIDMLYDGASEAKGVIAAFEPKMSKGDYLEYCEGLFKTERYSPGAG